jgi:hypothetical protein
VTLVHELTPTEELGLFKTVGDVIHNQFALRRARQRRTLILKVNNGSGISSPYTLMDQSLDKANPLDVPGDCTAIYFGSLWLRWDLLGGFWQQLPKEVRLVGLTTRNQAGFLTAKSEARLHAMLYKASDQFPKGTRSLFPKRIKIG